MGSVCVCVCVTVCEFVMVHVSLSVSVCVQALIQKYSIGGGYMYFTILNYGGMAGKH